MLMMGGLLDMHHMSSGLVSCRRCNAVAESEHGLIVLSIRSLTCTGCMKLTKQTPNHLHLPFDACSA